MTSPAIFDQKPFFTLSERLAELEKSYRAGNDFALYGAFMMLADFSAGDDKDRDFPEWVLNGIRKALEDHLLGRAPVKPGERSLKTQYKSRRIHWYRYIQVVLAKAQGATWDKAYKAAAKALTGTIARGSQRAMTDSYLKVNKELKNPKQSMQYHPAVIPEADTLLLDSKS